jgi:hypothetical protein
VSGMNGVAATSLGYFVFCVVEGKLSLRLEEIAVISSFEGLKNCPSGCFNTQIAFDVLAADESKIRTSNTNSKSGWREGGRMCTSVWDMLIFPDVFLLVRRENFPGRLLLLQMCDLFFFAWSPGNL